MVIDPAGLFIHRSHGFLGATPDGLIGDNAVVEIKCLHSLHKRQESLQDALCAKRPLCVAQNGSEIHLKESHNYYYQVCYQVQYI